mmetsp:Transcript_46757/g.141651  ORF Transcript_46757/g.141651 Transcript_46757/m.141651 type:complete len:342 (-) Transcript_46757:482-1507(-)
MRTKRRRRRKKRHTRVKPIPSRTSKPLLFATRDRLKRRRNDHPLRRHWARNRRPTRRRISIVRSGGIRRRSPPGGGELLRGDVESTGEIGGESRSIAVGESKDVRSRRRRRVGGRGRRRGRRHVRPWLLDRVRWSRRCDGGRKSLLGHGRGRRIAVAGRDRRIREARSLLPRPPGGGGVLRRAVRRRPGTSAFGQFRLSRRPSEGVRAQAQPAQDQEGQEGSVYEGLRQDPAEPRSQVQRGTNGGGRRRQGPRSYHPGGAAEAGHGGEHPVGVAAVEEFGRPDNRVGSAGASRERVQEEEPLAEEGRWEEEYQDENIHGGGRGAAVGDLFHDGVRADVWAV